MIEKILLIFLCFTIYSFLGWICEVIYCYIIDRKVVNRGFLNGPICPVYGVGAIITLCLLNNKYLNSSIVVFICGGGLATIVEYVTGFILEKIFRVKLWDYSNYKFNIKGRVCLLNSSLFGLMSVLLVKIIHPNVSEILGITNKKVLILIGIILVIVIVIDLIVTVKHVLGVNKIIQEIDINKIIEDIHEKRQKLRMLLRSRIQKRIDKAYPKLIERYKDFKK